MLMTVQDVEALLPTNHHTIKTFLFLMKWRQSTHFQRFRLLAKIAC